MAVRVGRVATLRETPKVVARGVLLDSGGVVLRPRGDRWNPRFDFEEVVRRHHPSLSLERLPEAIERARPLVDSARGYNRGDYHRCLLGALGVSTPSDTLIAELDRPLRYRDVVEVYDDVVPALNALAASRVPMAIVSDNSPGLERVYAEFGLDHYFDLFVISAVVGVTKPDPLMYRTASDGLGLTGAECLFVDDDPELVAAAIALGYQGAALLRSGETASVPVLRTLADLPEIVLSA